MCVHDSIISESQEKDLNPLLFLIRKDVVAALVSTTGLMALCSLFSACVNIWSVSMRKRFNKPKLSRRWAGEDSNLRSPFERWFYRPLPLTARPPTRFVCCFSSKWAGEDSNPKPSIGCGLQPHACHQSCLRTAAQSLVDRDGFEPSSTPLTVAILNLY